MKEEDNKNQKDLKEEKKPEKQKLSKEEKKALKKEKKEQKKANGETFGIKFANTIKKRWLISGTNTILLILIMIAVFILINVAVDKADFTAIDCTTSQDYTLTDESKERVADIDQEVNIYFVGWEETEVEYTLAKQYNKANSNINVEIVDPTEDLEFAEKYDVDSDSYVVIVESGESSRTLSYYDMITYDSSYNTVSIAEQKITSAILNVTSGVIPKVYYLTGYTSYSFTDGLSILAEYLDDEVLTYEELNILTTGEVPDDCDALIIMTPEKDFDELVADEIIEYINQGGNILWLNGIYTEDLELTNVNRVLAEYGIEGFDVGVVFETNTSNIVLNSQLCFIPSVQYTDLTSDIYEGLGLIFVYANKINIDTDSLEDLNVEETDLILSSETSYFSTSLSSSLTQDEEGSFILGAQMVKTIETEEEDDEEDEEDEEDTEETTDEDEEEEEEEALTSTLIIYGNDAFVSDYAITSNTSSLIYLYNNADLALNSIASLTDRDQDITIRKSYSDSSTEITPTDAEISTIMKIIFIVPIAIIVLGIVIWIVRKRKV